MNKLKKAVMSEFIRAIESTQLKQESKQESEAFDRAINEGNLDEAVTHLKKVLMIERRLLKNLLEELELKGVKVVNKDEAKAIDDAFNQAFKDVDKAEKNYNEAIKKNDFDNANKYLNDAINYLTKAFDSMKALHRKAQDKVNEAIDSSIEAIKRS